MPRHVKRSQSNEHRPARRRLRPGRVLLLAGGMLAAAICVAVAVLVVKSVVTLPNVSDPRTLGASSVVYDAAGQAVADIPSPVDRTPLTIQQIPPLVQNAFIAVEDHYFYQDEGFSLRGILRAAYYDLRGAPLQGGSTITQQLAKQLYLTPQDTLTRKIQEAILGIQLARRYTKPQILDMYLNWIYLGEHAYGVAAASQAYFGKPLSQLTVPQVALLAGLPKSPNGDDPLLHPKAALARRNVVLSLMARYGVITQAQANADSKLGLELSPPPTTASTSYPYPWFIDQVITQLEQTYHFSAQEVAYGGLKIYTTLVPSVYDAAQQAVTANIARLDAEKFANGQLYYPQQVTIGGHTITDPLQAAVVIMNQQNGNVLAIIGGDTHSGYLPLDRATQTQHQTGSSIKPLVDYTQALRDGYTAGTTVMDAPTIFHPGPGQTYVPTDDSPLYYGLTTFTEGLRRSVNLVALKVLQKVGIGNGVREAEKLGLTSLTFGPNDHLSVALGGTVGCCTPLEMADAYATLANGGNRVTPRFITSVVGPNGQSLLNNPPHLQHVLDPRVAYVITKMLETVDSPQIYNTPGGWDVNSGPYDSNWGTGYDAALNARGLKDYVPGWSMAAKTGTTNSNRSAWYVGYTPLYTSAVWVGRDEHYANYNLYGDYSAGPIMAATMAAALQGQTPVHFQQPPGIVEAKIDIMAPPWTVAKPGPLTPSQYVRNEWFVAGTQPTRINPLWVQAEVDSADPNTLWAPGCAGSPVTKTVLDLNMIGRGPEYYTMTWADQMAKLMHMNAPQELLPKELALTAPTQVCAGAIAPPPETGASSSASGASGTGTASSSGTGVGVATSSASAGGGTSSTSSSTGASNCASDQKIVVSGQTLDPSSICVPQGSLVALTFTSGDGLAHTLTLDGYGQHIAVPATGAPVTIQFRANLITVEPIVDSTDGATVGQLLPGS